MPSDYMDHTQRIIYLLSKRLKHGLSKQEEEEIQLWRESSSQNKRLFQELTDEHAVHILLDELQQYKTVHSMARLRGQMAKYPTRKKWSYYIAAASILLAVGLGALLNRYHLTQLNTSEIQPGQFKAQLTLQDGSSIALDSMRIGETTSKQGIVITKAGDGKITCNYQTSANTHSTRTSSFNVISTPAGGAYQIILPDGSTVWLNANSALKFPTQFNNTERYVELSGEGYFEIQNNQVAPFKVAVNKQIITVLGTKFNILAYQEDATTRTTLVEGAIKVGTSRSNHILKPGQEARVYKNSEKLEVVLGNVNEAIAWKNGYFIFNNENIKTIMQKVSRWYNIEVVYKGNMEGITFGGTFSKSKSLQKLLKSFESTGKMHYKIEGRRVTIMPE